MFGLRPSRTWPAPTTASPTFARVMLDRPQRESDVPVLSQDARCFGHLRCSFCLTLSLSSSQFFFVSTSQIRYLFFRSLSGLSLLQTQIIRRNPLVSVTTRWHTTGVTSRVVTSLYDLNQGHHFALVVVTTSSPVRLAGAVRKF